MAHIVLRQDEVAATHDGTYLVSGRFYDGDNFADIDNGVAVEIGELEEGEREIHKVTLASADSTDWGWVSTPEVDSLSADKHYNLPDFYNRAGRAIRVTQPHKHDVISLTVEAFDAAPAVGDGIALSADGKYATAASGTFAHCIAIDVVNGVTFYVIKVD